MFRLQAKKVCYAEKEILALEEPDFTLAEIHPDFDDCIFTYFCFVTQQMRQFLV